MGEGDAALLRCVWPTAQFAWCGTWTRTALRKGVWVAGGREAARRSLSATRRLAEGSVSSAARLMKPWNRACHAAVSEGKCAATSCDAVGSRALRS